MNPLSLALNASFWFFIWDDKMTLLQKVVFFALCNVIYAFLLLDVIHTVGPVAEGTPGPAQKEDLSNCYKNSMYLASESKLRSVVRYWQ